MPLVHDTARVFMPDPDAPVPHVATGPLSGRSFAVKDLFDVAGYPASGGQPFLLAMSGIKQRTAPTVHKLLDAGARFVGKTITNELAFSMNGQNAHFGLPVTGGAPDGISGGSSSGSAAAVSGRLCDFALGTDTGGSERAPASACCPPEVWGLLAPEVTVALAPARARLATSSKARLKRIKGYLDHLPFPAALVFRNVRGNFIHRYDRKLALIERPKVEGVLRRLQGSFPLVSSQEKRASKAQG